MLKAPGDTTERISRAQLRTERIKTLGHRQPIMVSTGTSLAGAIATMQANDGEPILITDGGRLLGVLTERDVLLKVLGREESLDASVDEVMTRDPHTLTADSTVGEALELMESGRYRTVPLVDETGAPAGLLRQQDIVEYVAEAFPQEILNLPPRPHQVMEEQEGA
ncbi:MAG: CBS domain-containing protein [Gemmatimonadota bacterium]|nr:CBS domain-containing protein [Gemmatimonadota bacterium]